jgi:integrase
MKVEPIIAPTDIKNIKKILRDNPRDHLLFVMGVNSGLRAQDLLNLRVQNLRDCKVGDRVTLKEKKTNKENVFIINKEIKNALEGHLMTSKLNDTSYLFKSRKGRNSPLTTVAVTKMVKRWCAAVNLKGNYGAHTLRKTWTYQQRKKFGVSWEVLSKRLNHSNPSITRRYLGIQEEEVEEILMHEI